MSKLSYPQLLKIRIQGVQLLVDKVNKTLESILKAYEKRLTADTTIPPKLKEYPNPIQEKVNLVRNHALIRDTQMMWEGPLPYSTDRRSMHVPNLEAIQEMSENEKEMGIGDEQEEKKRDPQLDIIPSLQEDKVNELWEEVHKLKDQDEGSLVSAPLLSDSPHTFYRIRVSSNAKGYGDGGKR